ncbi:MAG: apolipoprotein N-acyltransferase [Deltaproteobacteria bacterium RIFCSPLOWO2_12_FULL_40_28]|nr:MAG: apolipoprotein N-acyltransferase [Deltaproteobacteria bacterium RIFCSPHIGHO2_02_FULL_40_28]OGQ20812.1 MAG: apolipoprotein N-acyltransferase [Deltaproteobacteria bacterium RIFCSPHIGHO2_12_FULL_40_32]OGQ39213.1 MAG: apolipoprotein N-acyltransferase [Deltaproteobacteria bacterium RIFCSPLOWO2_02_FULL_40_36]OGQ54494.1 MAG: apolipoprotein N-acyltransferase [Deltaproteobacteria bacterium RIFCSPLOWO2_12_FULL_40_28]
MKSFRLAFISGLVGIFIFPTVLFGFKIPDLGFLAWVFLIPLLWRLSSLGYGSIFSHSFLSYFLTALGALYWMVPAMKNFGGLNFLESLGVLVLAALILACYFSLSTFLGYFFHRKGGQPLYLTLPVFWLLADYAKTYFPVNGFPWLNPAYSQGSYLPLFQWIELTGVFGLTFFIYCMNVLFFECLNAWKTRDKNLLLHCGAIFFVLLVISILASVGCQIFQEKRQSSGVATIGLIQGNIPQDMKWDSSKAQSNFKIYADLSYKARTYGADFIIWPETAYPYTLSVNKLALSQFVESDLAGLNVLFGAVSIEGLRLSEQGPIFNSAFLIDKDSHILSFYHKRHLVPFGEYVPMKNWLSFARRLTVAVGDFSEGKSSEPLQKGEVSYGVLICYEDLFPNLSRASVLSGAHVLVNLTNDAWYGNTSAQYQHVVFSQFRALENRRYLLRATNTGLTAVINPRGQIVEQLKPFDKNVLVKMISLSEANTLYTYLGSVIILFSFLYAGYCIFQIFLPRKDSHV